MIQKILQSGNPVLRKKSKPIKAVDKRVLQIITDLKDTLKNQKDPEGVGLAAPQIGVNLQIFIADYKNFKRIMINPKILKILKKPANTLESDGGREILEGCLSLPFYYGPLKRAEKILVEYLDETGKRKEEIFEKFDAQVVLHEIDHLNGVLFLDRLLEEGKTLYKVQGSKWEEVELA